MNATSSARPLDRSRPLWSKVPEITVYFWIAKILTTAMGEATSDYLVFHIDPVFAVTIGTIGLCIALIAQFAVRRYVAWVYWFLVVMVSITGTMVADIGHRLLGISFAVSTLLFTIILGIIFAVWHRVEHTLSIHSIVTRRREAFYWATVMATFALGTAAGDMTAATLHLGYLVSGLLFAALFLVPAIGYWKFELDGVFAFWFAYIMTRPLGASFADWAAKPATRGGLGEGTLAVSIVLTVLIVVVVVYLSATRIDAEDGATRQVDATT